MYHFPIEMYVTMAIYNFMYAMFVYVLKNGASCGSFWHLLKAFHIMLNHFLLFNPIEMLYDVNFL